MLKLLWSCEVVFLATFNWAQFLLAHPIIISFLGYIHIYFRVNILKTMQDRYRIFPLDKLLNNTLIMADIQCILLKRYRWCHNRNSDDAITKRKYKGQGAQLKIKFEMSGRFSQNLLPNGLSNLSDVRKHSTSLTNKSMGRYIGHLSNRSLIF